uniref:Uncharacterized protein n=1 Tax=Sinorhizobium sp. M14 TaxID=430451 RepID=A0A142BPT5_9HYPH|nr:hypothetical protein pSinB_234 [Sinorhizobium sp. M14]
MRGGGCLDDRIADTSGESHSPSELEDIVQRLAELAHQIKAMASVPLCDGFPAGGAYVVDERIEDRLSDEMGAGPSEP